MFWGRGGQHCACCGKIWPKISLPKGSFIIFLKFFLSFLGFSMVKIHFFQKVLKKWSSFRKKILYIFSTSRGGGQDPKWNFPLFFNFFFEPFPNSLFIKNSSPYPQFYFYSFAYIIWALLFCVYISYEFEFYWI